MIAEPLASIVASWGPSGLVMWLAMSERGSAYAALRGGSGGQPSLERCARLLSRIFTSWNQLDGS